MDNDIITCGAKQISSNCVVFIHHPGNNHFGTHTIYTLDQNWMVIVFQNGFKIYHRTETADICQDVWCKCGFNLIFYFLNGFVSCVDIHTG